MKVPPRKVSIIKRSNYNALFITLGVIALGAGLYFGIGILQEPPERHPWWAPRGCAIYRDTQQGHRIIVYVRDPRDFDTEAKCATVILDALENEKVFLDTSPDPYRRNLVEIHFPESTEIRGQVLLYAEVTYPTTRTYLSMQHAERQDFRTEVTIKKLREVADGKTTLGFLEQEE